MIIVWLAALGATVVVALMVALAYVCARKVRPEPRDVAPWALRLWVLNFLLDLVILYSTAPALTGPYWGMQWLLWPLLLTGVFALFGGSFGQIRAGLDALSEGMNGDMGARLGRMARGNAHGLYGARSRFGTVDSVRRRVAAPISSGLAGGVAVALVFVVALLFNGVISAATTWGDGNAKALAHLPQITTEPLTQGLPPTDVNHIVLVDQGVAAYLGQQVLAANGQNLGSTYHINPGAYVLQSVNDHLYWVAPLTYNNVWANLGQQSSPGYVVVDAEDPNATPVLRTGYHLRYLQDAILNQAIIRHTYLSGYTYGDLTDPTFEVDEHWQPYYTISLTQPTRGFTGRVVKQVLLVDAQTGAITAYAPDKVPSWVDRVTPESFVNDYMTWWGAWNSAPWFNPSGKGQQTPAGGTELVYNSVDHPVWLQMMTSSSGTDQSSTGVVLFDTRDMRAAFYPISGLGVDTNVTQTIAGNPQNLRGYDIGSLALYSIYGEPTWVATFVRSADTGEIFQAVGMVDARHLSGANVIMASTKSDALAQYSQWLADHAIQGSGVTANGHSVKIIGQVARISSATELGNTVYYLLLNGQQHIFKAGIQLSPELPLVQPGDTVQITYLDTGLTVATVTNFSDQSIQISGNPASTPSPSPHG